jgi:hypothetical protein
VLVERKARCKEPNALCSYHGAAVTGVMMVNRVTTTKTATYTPGTYTMASTPATPIEGKLVLDRTTQQGEGYTRIQRWDSGYSITTIVTVSYTATAIAPNGTVITSGPFVTTDLAGAITSISISTLYETVDGLTIYHPCLRYEYNNMNDTPEDTHGRVYDFNGKVLDWRKE